MASSKKKAGIHLFAVEVVSTSKFDKISNRSFEDHGRLEEAFGEPLGVRQLQPPRAARRRPPSLLPLQACALLRDRLPGAALEEGRPQEALRGPGPAEASARGERGGGWGLGPDVRDLH